MALCAFAHPALVRPRSEFTFSCPLSISLLICLSPVYAGSNILPRCLCFQYDWRSTDNILCLRLYLLCLDTIAYWLTLSPFTYFISSLWLSSCLFSGLNALSTRLLFWIHCGFCIGLCGNSTSSRSVDSITTGIMPYAFRIYSGLYLVLCFPSRFV